MSGESKRILVVDDSPQIVDMLTSRLTKRGYTIVSAQDGEQALERVREERPDLVILDVMMPKKNGWEVARAIRKDETLKDTRILVLTAIGEQINEMTSPLYGADAHLDKPFDFGELEAKIAELLG
jgi:DNA-binding response OmpR family regulator